MVRRFAIACSFNMFERPHQILLSRLGRLEGAQCGSQQGGQGQIFRHRRSNKLAQQKACWRPPRLAASLQRGLPG